MPRRLGPGGLVHDLKHFLVGAADLLMNSSQGAHLIEKFLQHKEGRSSFSSSSSSCSKCHAQRTKRPPFAIHLPGAKECRDTPGSGKHPSPPACLLHTTMESSPAPPRTPTVWDILSCNKDDSFLRKRMLKSPAAGGAGPKGTYLAFSTLFSAGDNQMPQQEEPISWA